MNYPRKTNRGRPPGPGKGNRNSAENEALVCKYHAEGMTHAEVCETMLTDHGLKISRQTVGAIIARASREQLAAANRAAGRLAEGERLDIHHLIALIYNRMCDGWNALPDKDRNALSTYRLHINLVSQLVSKVADIPEPKQTTDDDRRKVEELVAKLTGGQSAPDAVDQATLN